MPKNLLSPSELEELISKPLSFNLPNGRKIAYYEYGDKNGIPAFFCHGTGSHIHVALFHKESKNFGYRIIVPDRPGIGLSDFDPKRTVLDSARDIEALANHLCIDKFGILGISGGGPTLLAATYLLPSRLRFAVDLACAVPLYTDPAALKQLGFVDRLFAKLGASMPLCLFQIPFSILGYQQKSLKNPQAFAKMMSSSMCKADLELFQDKNLQYLFMRDFQELFRQGAKGPALDAQLIYHKWGFDLHQITYPLQIRQGTDDKWIPPSFSQYLAKTLKNVNIYMVEGQGHFYHMVYAEETLKMVDNFINK